MGLPPGSRLGPYEIAASLDAGGTGEVYRARDTRLGRDVTIKVLPPGITATPEARLRFEREAHAVSKLNHPNICTLHDVGRQGDIDFLVMELVAGGSLRDRLARKALPLEQVLALGIEIADALEAEHALGLVHRGLSPENVLLTEEGQARVTGFGVVGAGTEAYMSPEQVRGEEVDARSDLFSLGAVLYEMASGRRAFEGSGVAGAEDAILNRDPAPVSLLRPGTPPELDRIIGKALEKDRELRYQTAAEIRSDLIRLKRDLDSSKTAGASVAGNSGSRVRAATASSGSDAEVRRRRLIRMAWTAGGAVVLAAAIILLIHFIIPPPPPPVHVRLSLDAPLRLGSLGTLRLSPDGRYLAFNASSRQPDSAVVNQIWIQPMDGAPARPLPGTEAGGNPFWSPDSKFIGFVPEDKVKIIEVEGGQPTTICAGVSTWDGSWGSSGTILLDDDAGILAVNSSGGQPRQAAWPDTSRGEEWCWWPHFLPDGRHFLYLAIIKNRPGTMALHVGRLGSKESKLLAVGEFSQVQYAPPGYILYQRGRTLFAQPFDAGRLRMTGDPVPVLDDVLRFRSTALGDRRAAFSASATGALVYRDELPQPRQEMVWQDRAGRRLGTLGPAGLYRFGIALSPDTSRVAISFVPPGEITEDIWIVDVRRNAATRLTSDPEWEIWPIWSPDGATIFYEDARTRIRMIPASGIGEPRELPMPPGDCVPQAVTPDGRYLLAIFKAPDSGPELVKVSLDANPRTTSLGLMGTDLSLSPDGRWLAYQSDETGRLEVYVVDFPGLTNKWRVSTNGGAQAEWSADGKELFYIALGVGMMAAPVSTVPTLRLGKPVRLHPPPAGRYAPASDGKRFLVILPTAGGPLPPTKVVLNWQAGLSRK